MQGVTIKCQNTGCKLWTHVFCAQLVEWGFRLTYNQSRRKYYTQFYCPTHQRKRKVKEQAEVCSMQHTFTCSSLLFIILLILHHDPSSYYTYKCLYIYICINCIYIYVFTVYKYVLTVYIYALTVYKYVFTVYIYVFTVYLHDAVI